MKRNILIIGVLVACVTAAWVFLNQGRGTHIDNISLTTLDGAVQTIHGKAPTLVTFWATSCPTCVAEMPDMTELYMQFQARNFRILAIAMQYDPIVAVNNYSVSHPVPFSIVHDGSGLLAKQFGNVQLTPTHFLLSSEGRVLYHAIGTPDFEHMARIIEQS